MRGCCAGIGRSITRIDQIDALKRPLTMEDGGVVLMDLLWSDPTTNDGVEGVQPSPRGPGLVTFGPDRVKEFCKVRGLVTHCCSAVKQRRSPASWRHDSGSDPASIRASVRAWDGF